jgi:hypothetical protein
VVLGNDRSTTLSEGPMSAVDMMLVGTKLIGETVVDSKPHEVRVGQNLDK